jgi:hypothetical protein
MINIEFIKTRFNDIKGFDEEELHLIRNKLLRIASETHQLHSDCSVYTSRTDYLRYLFMWHESQEGGKFWYRVYAKLAMDEGQVLTDGQIKLANIKNIVSDGEDE